MHDGTVAHLKDAKFDIGKGEVATDKPVQIVNKGSRIAADSMSITKGGDVMVFQDRVRMTIPGNNVQSASQKEAANAGK